MITLLVRKKYQSFHYNCFTLLYLLHLLIFYFSTILLGEEAQKPQRNIPLGTMLSLLIVFLAYFGVSAVLTLMLPYYSLDEAAPIPDAFDSVGWWFAMYIVTIGGICGLVTR